MSVIGFALQLAYRLRRHFWLGWSLARWLGVLIAAAGIVILVRFWARPWWALPAAGLLLVYLLALGWAGRRGYVYFRAAPQGENPLAHDASPVPPLHAEEWLPMRASGWFTVEGQDQYYVDLDADFETVETREHIVLGRVHPSKFLLVGGWPSYELGWWYIFFQPAMIREMSLGTFYSSSTPQLGLRVVYAPDEETQQTIYLAFGDTKLLRRVWDDLILDAPSGVGQAASQQV